METKQNLLHKNKLICLQFEKAKTNFPKIKEQTSQYTGGETKSLLEQLCTNY